MLNKVEPELNTGESEFWTFERVGMLVIYRDQGLTTDEIVPLIGATRNAICGKASRLRLPPPGPRKTVKPTPLPPPRSAHEFKLRLHRYRHIPSTEIAAINTKPVPFLERRKNQCASIMNERGKNGLALCCGRPTVPASPWCEAHFLLYTQPLKEQTDGEARYRNQQL